MENVWEYRKQDELTIAEGGEEVIPWVQGIRDIGWPDVWDWPGTHYRWGGEEVETWVQGTRDIGWLDVCDWTVVAKSLSAVFLASHNIQISLADLHGSYGAMVWWWTPLHFIHSSVLEELM